MNVLSLIELIITLLSGVAAGFNKAGLVEAAAGVEAAITSLQTVHGSEVTRAQIEGMKITPQW